MTVMKDRKNDHIELAFLSQLDKISVDERFNYEPFLNSLSSDIDMSTDFLGKKLNIPIWVSSMTGGTQMAEKINTNLAKACNEFGMGMGLGSCRELLKDDNHFHQFDMRKYLGDDLPLFANLGIAQIEKLIEEKETEKIDLLIDKLHADGLFIHVNPLQEFFQPEGDTIRRPPIETIEELLELVQAKIIVKEVGQGIGHESLEALVKLPIAGIEFGAYGGTNFTKVELLRSDKNKYEIYAPFLRIGHTADEMLSNLNKLKSKFPEQNKQLIISGGIKTFLDGYYLIKKSLFPAVYGQASVFLKYAKEDYSQLKKFIEFQVKGLFLAYALLRIKSM